MRIAQYVFWIGGRFNSKLHKRTLETRNSLKEIPDSFPSKKIWFHVASLGEYEQAKPVIDLFLKNSYGIILSFFSPSGYEHVKIDHPNIIKEYIRIDTKRNSKLWVSHYKPEGLILVKYDVWFRHIYELKQRGTPVYLISAYYPQVPWYFRSYAIPFDFKNLFTHIFLQDNSSKLILEQIQYEKYSVVGDTRVDRVLDVGKFNFSNPMITDFIHKSEKIIVFGSTWISDERLAINIIKNLPNSYRYLIAPHEISSERITELVGLLNEAKIEFAKITDSHFNELDRVLIINKIGILKHIYQYADIAHIGGGWDKGVHNVLEAVAYDIPVTCGPRHHRSIEISQLAKMDILQVIENSQDFVKFFHYTNVNKKEIEKKISIYLNEQKGASDKIYEFITSQFE